MTPPSRRRWTGPRWHRSSGLGEGHAVRAEKRFAVSRRAVATFRSRAAGFTRANSSRSNALARFEPKPLGHRTCGSKRNRAVLAGWRREHQCGRTGHRRGPRSRSLAACTPVRADQHGELRRAVTVFDTKYTYNFWRPVTAIRAADTDGNPLTVPDGDWLSYQNTPPYPDYTCGLTNADGFGAGRAARILRYRPHRLYLHDTRRYYGDRSEASRRRASNPSTRACSAVCISAPAACAG